jgi:hypothetical protein
VAALQDGLDADGEGSFEAAAYAGRGAAAARPLDRLALGWCELAGAAGVARAYLEEPRGQAARLGPPAVRVADVLAVVPGPRSAILPVNVNTAPGPVLAALLGEGRVAAVRAVESLRAAAPLASLDPIALLVDPLHMARIRPWLDVRSSTFRITAVAAEPPQRVRVVALAERALDGRVRMLAWTEDGGVP